MKQPHRTMLVAALLLLGTTSSPGQGETVVPFLLIPASPETNGMGGVSSAFISTHPMAPVGNPAQLGLFSTGNFVSAGIFVPETNLAPWSGMAHPLFRTLAINAGIDLRDYIGLPVSAGIGYSRLYLDLGDFIITGPTGPEEIGRYHSYETSDNISLAVGIDSWVKFGAGATVKFINSHLGVSSEQQGEGSASVTGYDIGLLLKIPAVDIASKAGADLSIPSLHIQPLLDLSVGFSKNNLGDRITYIDPSQADPLPRRGSLGAGIEGGVASTLLPDGWRLFTAGLFREASDLLVQRHSDGTWEYTGGMGDVDFLDNVISGRGGSTITQRKGWQIDIAELFLFRGGSATEPSTAYTTSGFGIRLAGVFKALSALGPEETSSWIDFIFKNLDLRYDHSQFEYSLGRRSVTCSSITVILKRMPF